MDDARADLLVRDCWPRLVPTAYLLTGDVPAAQDLVRSALSRRLGRGPAAEPELRDAVVREAFRHRHLYEAGSAPFAEQGGSAEPMRAVLRRLPLDERAVLMMRWRDGFDVEQVTDVLRAPKQTVGKREKRALRALGEAGLVPPDGEPQPGELRTMLDAVADVVPWSAPPDTSELLARRRRRLWPR